MPHNSEDAQDAAFFFAYSHRQQVAHLLQIPITGLMQMWDAYDGTNEVLGFTGEAIHQALNLRGHGRYCAV